MNTLPPTRIALALLLTIAAILPTSSARAEPSPVVVELFTSQGCYSCPPAEAYLGELAARPDIVALEFHVDYWNDTRYLWHGKWQDPFSSPANTARQRRYNQAIRGINNLYTPQMVIGGAFEAVGSRRQSVIAAIAAARPGTVLSVSVDGNRRRATVEGPSPTAAEVFQVTFIKEKATRVESGENHGKTLMSHNIVTALRKVGEWRGRRTQVALAALPDAAHGCAVIVQAPNHGPILGASLCP